MDESKNSINPVLLIFALIGGFFVLWGFYVVCNGLIEERRREDLKKAAAGSDEPKWFYK